MPDFIVTQTEEGVNNVITLLRSSAVKKVSTISTADSNLVHSFDLESHYLAMSIDDTLIENCVVL